MIDLKQFLTNINIKYSLNIEANELMQNFIRFMEDNNWFGIHPQFIQATENDKVLTISLNDADFLERRVCFFLQNKEKSTLEKIQIIDMKMQEKFPKSSCYFNKFLRTHQLTEDDTLALWDYLLWSLKKEIFYYNNKEITGWMEQVCIELSVRHGNLLCDFLFELKNNYHTDFNLNFSLKKRASQKNHAYDQDIYLQLIYYLFNQEYIDSISLYEKAAQNRDTTDAWLYLSLHFISALRDTDLLRIPHPRLRRKPAEILNAISNGTFPKKEAILVVNSILQQLKNLPLVPSKTSTYSGIPTIKLSIPESAIEHFGILFSAAEAHYQISAATGPFIRRYQEYRSLCKHLGEEIGELFLERNFSARSANKAYMQAIELFSDEILDHNIMEPHAKGYMLAALARSHKGSYGEFCKTTEIYLKDANFSGYSAEFIARELFERGVCSFMTSLLLNMVTDGGYRKLTIPNQTKLSNLLGMSPLDIENSVSISENSIYEAQNIIAEIISISPDEQKETILSILHRLGSGYAASKTSDSLCLMSACKRKCPYPEKRNCIGCSYEIHTKSIIYLLSSEFKRLYDLREKTKDNLLYKKYTALMRDTVAPAINEIFICIQSIYGSEAIRELEQIIKETNYE